MRIHALLNGHERHSKLNTFIETFAHIFRFSLISRACYCMHVFRFGRLLSIRNGLQLQKSIKILSYDLQFRETVRLYSEMHV